LGKQVPKQENFPGNPVRGTMKVNKDQFDALLGKLMQTPPQPATSIKTQGKAGKIIPAAKPAPAKQ
jgi:hypothetical protein